MSSPLPKELKGLLLPAAPDGEKGRLTASILSACDLPESINGDSALVSMEILGKEVRTGPPSAKHRDRNSFKFVPEKSAYSKGSQSSKNNEISISAPLELLYSESAVFKVMIGNNESLVAEVELSKVLHANEPKWMILHLEPESSEHSAQTASPTQEDEQDTHAPTLRLRLCMTGPFRPEISAILSMSKSWFGAMDQVTAGSSSAINSLTSILPKTFPSGKLLLIPTVPIVAASAVLLPVLLGILAVGLPFFLPIIVGLLVVAGSLGIVGTGVYLTSSKGRETASQILGPVVQVLTATKAGQQMLYETGPRPSPVALAEILLPNDMIGHLVVSLLIDFIGSSSYLLPVVGETFDLAWAPIQTILLMAMYDKTMPSLKYISFIEEIMPFTDVIPSGTLGWVRRYSPLVLEAGLKRVPDNVKDIIVGEKRD
eukprot:scaffold6631_cov287-Chaetoceros_neogracile.AAC.6